MFSPEKRKTSKRKSEKNFCGGKCRLKPLNVGEAINFPQIRMGESQELSLSDLYAAC